MRSHETRVEIDAPIEDVWKALTDAAEAARWFAPKMEIDLRPGGEHVADWGPGLRWRTTVEVVERLKHLRLGEVRDEVFSAAAERRKLPSARLVQEYYLETENGRTVLRMVHSGFGSAEAWDEEYEGTRQGWRACFLRMKLMLERHRGEVARNFIVSKHMLGVSRAEALAVVRSAAPAGLSMVFDGETEFAGVVPDWNHSVFNVSSQTVTGGCMLYFEFVLWGVEESRAEAIREEWSSKFE
ncbi:MAG: SRPBCC domain-containing protein [Acidobacteria bacterium]|nr:SRPBCC domain-containing protein [Acidobacteriota bacterium]